MWPPSSWNQDTTSTINYVQNQKSIPGMNKIPSSSNHLWLVMLRILNQLLEPKTIPLTEHGKYIPHHYNPLRYHMIKTQLAPQRNLEDGIFHTHITLSITIRWGRRCTTTSGNLQHGIITSVWEATKHYIQYSRWVPVPPLQVWTPLFQAPHMHGKVEHHPQEVRKVWHPHMSGMHVFQIYSQTMAWVPHKDPTQDSSSHQLLADSIVGPASITNSKASGIDVWHPHYQKI